MYGFTTLLCANVHTYGQASNINTAVHTTRMLVFNMLYAFLYTVSAQIVLCSHTENAKVVYILNVHV